MSSASRASMFYFFFQAEDGIRDYKVTGVQTCALPISAVQTATARAPHLVLFFQNSAATSNGASAEYPANAYWLAISKMDGGALRAIKIGRASCRERV